MFGRKYPNSGQVRTQLNEFDERVSKLLDEKSFSKGAFIWEDVDLCDEYIQETGKNHENTKASDKKPDNVFSNLKKYKFNPIKES